MAHLLLLLLTLNDQGNDIAANPANQITPNRSQEITVASKSASIVLRRNLLHLLDSLPQKGSNRHDGGMSKRTVSVTVKMTEDDLKLLVRAANTIWPKAVLTQSGIMLGLARIGAETVLKKK